MTLADLVPLLPLVVVTTGSLVLLMVIAFFRNYPATVFVTLLTLGLAFISLPFSYAGEPRQITPLLIVDSASIFYTGLLLATTFILTLLSHGYIRSLPGNREEFFLLLLLATTGTLTLAVSSHFASFFLGLELLSVSLYTLVAYQRFPQDRIEAGIKYLILAGATSAFLLFGMALIYAVQGSMEFGGVSPAALAETENTLLLAGWALATVGVGFKLALVPFHLWTPDVYQGAPAPVTAFIATVSKGGVFALFLRFFPPQVVANNEALWTMFAGIAVASMLYGNLVALMQTNVKRILAYSSIAQLGYLLVAFLASGELGLQASAFFLSAYFITTLMAFGVIMALSNRGEEADELADYHGLFWRERRLALVFTAALLSLAGIPPTAGLIGKIYVVAAGVQASLWFLLIVLVLGSIIGVFYYLRIVIRMFRRPEEAGEAFRPLLPAGLSLPSGFALALLTVLLVGLGIFPGPLFQIVQAMVTVMNGP
jgi:NADH-quinone oxidoreductase subunit N